MVKKNLLKTLMMTSALLLNTAAVEAKMAARDASYEAVEYKELASLPARKDVMSNEDLKKVVDQFMSAGSNPANLFKAYDKAVRLGEYAAKAAKAKGPKKVDLYNPAIAAYSIVQDVLGLLDKVRLEPGIAAEMLTACFAGDSLSDGSMLRGFLSFKGEDVEGYVASIVTSHVALEKWRREFAILAQNLAYSLPKTYEQWSSWEANYAKMRKKQQAAHRALHHETGDSEVK